MRTTTKLSAVIASIAALLATSATTIAPAIAGPPGDTGNATRYPSVFRQAGYTQGQINQKIDQAWDQLFYGDPGTAADRSDGQTVFYHLNSDMAYVEDIGNQDVRTEGMGYAMMIAAQLNHQTEFDELWNFAKNKMQIQSGGEKYFFAWHTRPDGTVIDSGVAPDGDQWIAAALVTASARWGDGSGIYDYGTQARQILHAMWHESDNGGVNMFDPTTDLPLFSPPATFFGYTDASYALPAFYRMFAIADPADKADWDAATTAGEKLLQDYNPTTGLTSCYSHFDGTPFMWPWESASDNNYDHTFQEDAWRVIANANVDASWWGTQPWQTQFSNTLENFFYGQGVTTYVSRYHLDGTPLSTGQNTYEPAHAQGLVAMNSTSAITSTQPYRDEFVQDLWNTPIPSGKARYFDGLLYFLGLLYDSGSFKNWLPGYSGHGAGDAS